MHSRLWIVAASSAALMSACSSTQATNDSTQSEGQPQGASDIAPAQLQDSSSIASNSQLGHVPSQRIATGQLITPTALRGSVQMALNPGLTNYPNFVAGEGFAIVMRKGADELKTKIDTALEQERADGGYAAIARKYFDFELP